MADLHYRVVNFLATATDHQKNQLLAKLVHQSPNSALSGVIELEMELWEQALVKQMKKYMTGELAHEEFNKILGIKTIRSQLNLGLREAKEYYERLEDEIKAGLI